MRTRVFIHDGPETSVTWKTFLRNLASGTWEYSGTPNPGQAFYVVVVPEKSRGVHNKAGRTMRVSIRMDATELKESQEREAAERLANARAIAAKQKQSYDAKWTGTYEAVVKGKKKSISGTVEAPDAYVAGDKLRAKFEKEHGTNYSYPVAKFQGGPKRLDPGSISNKVARKAGPEED